MAQTQLTYPFEAIHGTLHPSDRFYTRMLNEKCILQSKPRKSTANQRAMRFAFGQKYKGSHSPVESIVAP